MGQFSEPPKAAPTSAQVTGYRCGRAVNNLVTGLVESRWEVHWWESCSAGTLHGESLVMSPGESRGESLQELALYVESPSGNALWGVDRRVARW